MMKRVRQQTPSIVQGARWVGEEPGVTFPVANSVWMVAIRQQVRAVPAWKDVLEKNAQRFVLSVIVDVFKIQVYV